MNENETGLETSALSYFCSTFIQEPPESVADPVFFKMGAYPCVWNKNLLFGNIFAENCMKNERNWTEGSRVPSALCLDPPMKIDFYFHQRR